MRLEECETEDAALGEEKANKVDEALDGVRSALDQIEAKGSRSMIPHLSVPTDSGDRMRPDRWCGGIRDQTRW